MRHLVLAALVGVVPTAYEAELAHAQPPHATVVIGDREPMLRESQPGELRSPFGVDFDAAGNMYIVELAGGRVHKRTADGVLSTIAGDGTEGYAGDGGPAARATFNGMHNVAVTPSGDIYIADSWNHCIRKIDAKSGHISTIAGTGEPGFSGDGGPATRAQFNYLMCITLNKSNDKIYCADLKNRRIRVVDLATGLVHTVAGNGMKGTPKDGALATASPLVDPRAVAVDSRDRIYILERAGHALRTVNSDGRIHTVAGTGQKGTAVGPALHAQFNSPKHLAVDQHNNIFIADDVNARVVKYDPLRKSVSVVLGDGVDSPSYRLKHPHGVCFHADGSLYVVDTGNHRIIQLR